MYASKTFPNLRQNVTQTQVIKQHHSINLLIGPDIPVALAALEIRCRGWCSNEKEVIKSIVSRVRAKEVKSLELDKDRLPVERVLGMHWDTETDTFGIKIGQKDRLLHRKGLELPVRVTITSEGKCIWEPGGRFISKCPVDVTYYPFDKQTCELIFANWVFSDIRFVQIQIYAPNGEWNVIGQKIYRIEFLFKCCPDFYPEVHFVILLPAWPYWPLITARVTNGRRFIRKIQVIVDAVEAYNRRSELEGKRLQLWDEWRMVSTTVDTLVFWLMLM
ncbi:hypothetical protein LSH36_581g04042 [Paralvinella palmiformis]|uniref:Neurotransmitter-gated ion-channel ligand-binding domain-containing protein n=1 Tax=Paralvinella palmiformis TaxID=53620 RepID=A0AAD9J5N5_9ANNE|nr:hypothetical protein LSH36_581g04042 [Paralvinella palmiformis]